jgi:hypothetical protein
VSARRLDARRLALVTDRFASPHDGERLAALDAAGRILAAGGATWRTLLDGQGDGHGVDDGEPREAPTHATTIGAMMRRPGAAALTEWERGFLTGCQRFDTLSRKQADMLAEVFAKIRRAEA